MHERAINLLGVFCNVSKIKASSFARRLESILSHCYGLLNSAGTLYFCRSSNLSTFCDHGSTGNAFSYRRSIELVSPIDSDRRKMEQIDRNSAPFGFLGLSGILFELTTVGQVVRTFYPLPSLRYTPRSVSALLCTERAARFRSDGAERNGNVTVFLTPTVL